MIAKEAGGGLLIDSVPSKAGGSALPDVRHLAFSIRFLKSRRTTQFSEIKISSHITYHWVCFYKKAFANLSKSPLLSLKWGLGYIPLGLFSF